MNSLTPSRRQLMATLAGLGIGSTVFQRAVVAQAPKSGGAITVEMIEKAEWITGLKLSESERKALVGRLNGSQRNFARSRQVPLPNDVPPAFAFVPSATPVEAAPRGTVEPTTNAVPKKPESSDDLAFLPVTALSQLVRTRAISSTELTKLYLARLKKYDPALLCVVTLTEELALKQAEAADCEIAAGRYRGPLHGIPWGAKDLISYPGYKTTWGAGPYKDQTLDVKATVARKLEEAGAVLVAKLTLGALAQGDNWFGGMTRNPWNVEQGSSGSSAGSASAVVAGLVGFAIGSETLGSIVSPCTRCGASGLRPTFGRISRAGCMTLAWTMDKLGPICRSIEDCALVLGAIHGADGLDNAAVTRPFHWPCSRDLGSLRVGYVDDAKRPAKDRRELQVLREIGVKLVPIEMPDKYPVDTSTILYAECAAAFDDLTRKGINDGIGSWGNTFRLGQFIPAVEYIRANRIRTLLMQEMEKIFEKVDLYVGGFFDLGITNLTGHPTAVMPNGEYKSGALGLPAMMLTGRLFGETELLAVAHAYQQATGYHLKRPDMSKVTVEEAGKKG